MRAIEISKNDRILIIAPHPDDECIGPGGVLLKYSEQCDVILLTDGRQGQGDLSPEKEKDIREREFISEMNKLSIKSFRMLEIEDGTLLAHTDCLENITISDYSLVFVTGLQDAHPDHKAAFLCLERVIRNISVDGLPRCFLYEVHTPLQHPTHFLDISKLLSEKVRLIQMHESQLKELPYDRLAEQNAAYRATMFRMPEKKIEVYEEVDLHKGVADSILETDILLQKERLMGWTLKRWVSRLLEKKTLTRWFDEKGIDEVYIYGCGELGKLLVKELSHEGIRIKAIIDRRAEQFHDVEIPVVHLESVTAKLPIIVTVIYEYAEINKTLREYGYEKIFSLKEIMESV